MFIRRRSVTGCARIRDSLVRLPMKNNPRPKNHLAKSQRKFPAFAERGFHPLIRVGVVGYLALCSVPMQFAVVVDRDGAEQQPLSVFAGDAEIRARGHAAFARADPIAAMRGVVVASARIGRTRQICGRKFVLCPMRTRQQTHPLAATARAKVTFRADENAVVTAAAHSAETAAPATASFGSTASFCSVTRAFGTAASTFRTAAPTFGWCASTAIRRVRIGWWCAGCAGPPWRSALPASTAAPAAKSTATGT